MTLRPHSQDDQDALVEVQEKRTRDVDAMTQVKSQRRWYEAETKKLKDKDLTIEDLENDELWQNHETYKEFDGEEFGKQTPEERRLDGEEAQLAVNFRNARKEEIAKRKLEQTVDEILAAPPTLEQKMANLTDEQHKALWERLQNR